MTNFETDKTWADYYTPQIRDIIKKELISDIIDIRIATEEEDKKQATDYQLIVVDGTSIGCRIRRTIEPLFYYKDVTFRKSRPFGTTEIEKMKLGQPRWYLYAWDDEGKLTYWVLIDLDKFRDLNMFDNADTKNTPNYDGSSTFDGWKICRLKQLGCLKNKSDMITKFLKEVKQPDVCIPKSQTTLV